MKKIALVNQRYGLEVNGGSEYYTRLIAEKLAKDYQVEVFTSKALSYEKWANYYVDDLETINGVMVRRFGVRHERKRLLMKILTRLITKLHLNFEWLCDIWVRQQGPYVPDLIQYIRNHKNEYDAFVFVTYLYYPTVAGLKEVKEKTILIPTAHNEPFIYFKSHGKLFNMPKAIIYLTEEEKALVERLYNNQSVPSVVAGVGVDVPEHVDNNRFREKYNIKNDYIIYVGRVDKSKGCHEMLRYFLEYYKKNDNMHLVIMGQLFMDIPKHPAIHYLGFVSEEDKFDGISGAKLLWLPSQFESLSIAVLEAMSLAVPILVNGKCEVLKGHCEKSNGGLYYTDYEKCSDALDKLLEKNCQKKMGSNAREYIERNYLWDNIIKKIEGLIEEI
ncbi:MAG: glycosyltransferase [Clostridium sp.]|nr:glycosyltransferase [Clostridium sp.]